MLFNSLEFALFLPLVFILYWSVFNKNLSLQNAFILIVSYFFYAWWDWRFLFLIGTSTLVDYYVGLALYAEKQERRRQLLLAISLAANLSLLGFFKYYDFFLDSFIDAFSLFGAPFEPNRLNVILPIGISFYTLQTLSYTIDIYKKRISPTKNLIVFGAFVSFFPQLVAGPIERAKNLLPQFFKARTFDYATAVNGLQQILWGIIKKVVIADNCARYVNYIYANSDTLPASSLVLGIFFFMFQLYGDFSGYSDIAIGVARLFGFELRKNFSYPFFAENNRQLWHRWHISLSSWFRDYVFFPLGGSQRGKFITWRNIIVVFLISGLWHGAGWHFIIWGILNGVLLIIPFHKVGLGKSDEKKESKSKLPKFRQLVNMLFTGSCFASTFVLFRSVGLEQGLNYYQGLFSASIISKPIVGDFTGAMTTIVLIGVFLIIEWLGRDKKFAIESMHSNHRLLRWLSYIVLVFVTMYFGAFDEVDFIYFQF